jgi:hypothetical protein
VIKHFRPGSVGAVEVRSNIFVRRGNLITATHELDIVPPIENLIDRIRSYCEEPRRTATIDKESFGTFTLKSRSC